MKEQFLRAFANLSIPERANPIYVDPKHGALSWHVVRIEVEAGTPIGDAAMKFLSDLKII